jgi:hypothetical protein
MDSANEELKDSSPKIEQLARIGLFNTWDCFSSFFFSQNFNSATQNLTIFVLAKTLRNMPIWLGSCWAFKGWFGCFQFFWRLQWSRYCRFYHLPTWHNRGFSSCNWHLKGTLYSIQPMTMLNARTKASMRQALRGGWLLGRRWFYH